jgi:hypothetical protein
VSHLFRPRLGLQDHPDRAWHDEQGGMCSAGEPYRCNRADEPNTSEVLIEDIATH